MACFRDNTVVFAEDPLIQADVDITRDIQHHGCQRVAKGEITNLFQISYLPYHTITHPILHNKYLS